MSASFALSMNIRWVEPETVWMLELGGRRPIMLSDSRVILVDRCVMSTLGALTQRPDRPDLRSESWWLRHLDSEEYTLNPILCACEGAGRRAPSFAEFCAALADARHKLAAGLPRARLTLHEDPRALYGIVAATTPRWQAAQRFLMDVAPRLVNRVTPGAAPRLEADVRLAAADAGLPRRSLALLAVLSCVYERRDGGEPMIGRRIINPRRQYSEQHAFNAVADLHSLELLAASLERVSPGIGLVTRDRALADFWCALGVSLPTSPSILECVTVSPRLELFPALDGDGLKSLISRM